MNKFIVFGLIIALVAPGILAAEWTKTIYVDLAFVPQENASSYDPTATDAILDVPIHVMLEDGRSGNEPSRIGEGGTDDDERFEVRAKNDIAPFAESAVRQTLAEWGFLVDREAERVLEARVVEFWVAETNRAVGSSYVAKFRADFALKNKAGRVLWQGSANGEAKRYGRKQLPANMNEVLSDALKIAIGKLVEQPELQAAWRAP